MGDDGGGSLISADRVAPSLIVGVSASDIFPCAIKVQKKISSGTGSPVWSQKKSHKMVVMLWLCVCCCSGRPLSSSRSRSSSSGSHASLSSLSTSGESEHLYRDIASDISSASSPAASPGHSVSDKPKTGESVPSVTL